MGTVDRDFLPLGSSFDVARRGYDRRQVDEHLDRLDADLRILAADRDAAVARAAELAKQLEDRRNQLAGKEQEIARLASAPSSMEGMSERVQRMLRLAQDEADEIRAQSETEAAELMARAEADGNALRERYQKLITEVEDRRAEMEREHSSIMDQARAEATRLVADATDRAKQLEETSSARRQQAEQDFEIAMSARRAEALQLLAEQEATSKAEAERRVQSATAEANRRLTNANETAQRRLAEAHAEVDELRALRAKIASQLRQVRSMLAEAAGALEPVMDERPTPQLSEKASENGEGKATVADGERAQAQRVRT